MQGGEDLDPKYVLSSRVRTGRSIKGYSLPPHCSRGERRAIEKLSVTGEGAWPAGGGRGLLGGAWPVGGGGVVRWKGAWSMKWGVVRWEGWGRRGGQSGGVAYGVGVASGVWAWPLGAWSRCWGLQAWLLGGVALRQGAWLLPVGVVCRHVLTAGLGAWPLGVGVASGCGHGRESHGAWLA